jgi:hypothetical protein
MSEEIRAALVNLSIAARVALSSHVCSEHGSGPCSDRERLEARLKETDELIGKSTELVFGRSDK